jgi:hypothetical protein
MKMDLKIIVFFIALTFAIYWFTKTFMTLKIDESKEFHLDIDGVNLDDVLKDIVQIEDND